MELNQTFDPNEVPEDDRNFDPIPAGEYDMQVIESKIEKTKSETGEMLVLTLEVISGPQSNRRVWDRLNIVNQNADAQRIAQRALADLCLAIGVAQLRNTEELHFKPFTGKVGIRQDKTGQFGPQNTVRYKARGGAAPAGKAQPSAAAARPAQAGGAAAGKPDSGGSRPWKNSGRAA